MPSSLRFALRSVARTPGFTLVVVACLALGIGVNVAFLGVLDVLLLRPPAGVRDAASLHRVEIVHEPVAGRRMHVAVALSRRDVARLAARRETFAQVAGYAGASDVSLGSGRDAREVDAAVVDGAYFGVVGARAIHGRLIGAADAAADAPATTVLSERLWRAAFGADHAVVGRRTRVNGRDVTIVGVAGDRFTGIEAGAVDLWLSFSAADVTGWPRDYIDSQDTGWLSALARLAPGATPDGAAAVATTIFRGAPASPHAVHGTLPTRTASLTPVTSRFGGGRPGLPVPVWLLGATGAVLLVACGNVANLLLARGEMRRRELATRAALGASRGALVRQLLAESAMLAAIGGAAGLVLAQLGTRAFVLLPDMPPLERLLDVRVTVATLAVVGLTTLLCGLVPALRGARPDTVGALRGGARTVPGRSRLRALLMTGQLAAALALLVTAGVFVRSLRAIHAVRPGIDLEHVVTASVDMARAGMGPAEARDFAARALERVRALPRVQVASLAAGAPFSRTLMVAEVGVTGVELPSPLPGGLQFVVGAGDGYFEAMGIPLRSGRAFTPQERGLGLAESVIVSESFARAAWGDADPLGRCVRHDRTRCARVVGVAANAALSQIREAAPLVVYQPMGAGDQETRLLLMVRARGGDVAATAREVRATLQAMDPRLPYVSAYALRDEPNVRSEYAPYRLGAAAFSLFGALALLVAAVGLYAVVAYSVARRTGEIGVRVALGATTAHVRRLVLGEGVRHALVGSAAGLLLGAAATRALRAKLYGVAPWDAPTFVAVTVVLIVVALLASWLPARRAAAIQPTQALRSE